MYASVIIDVAAAAVDRVFSYRVPAGMAVSRGFRVRVPFGPREKEGFIIDLTDTVSYDESKIKDIVAPLEDYPALLPSLIDLAEEIKAQTHCPLCEAMRLMLPAEMRGGRIKVKTETCVRLLIPLADVQEAIDKEKRSQKRRLLLSILSDGQAHALSEIKQIIRDPSDAIDQLVKRDMITTFERDVLRAPYYGEMDKPNDPELTLEQREALSELLPALKDPVTAKPFLLHGVTGSGKTEVYIRLVRQVLKTGKGAIILVPEIVLTPQMISWFRSRFGNDLAVMHSRLTPGERFDEWRRIRLGSARIVIGARSAVFAPVENLGVIIIDEEHEQTYLSDSFPQYDARQIAASRCQREGAVLLMASATPSVLSYAMSRRGDYTLLEMPHRVMNRPMPEVTLVDMREELRRGNHGMFSSLLMERLRVCVEEGHQAMLFINRRGYANFVNCRACGTVIKCPHCDVSMTYHSVGDALHCHYCGYELPMPSKCPTCASKHIRACGVGTQKVEEELNKLFPGAGVIRMDVDTTSQRNAHFDLLSRFRAGEARILLGTQMIAKGLDFPRVTLVGAVLADMTLNLPDYRAPERTFQLLVQVAGRSGRDEIPGEVVIQTYKPDHYAVQAAAKQDYRLFFAEEFERRKIDLYPPFTVMARFLCEASEPSVARETAEGIRERILQEIPADSPLRRRIIFIRAGEAPISRIKNYCRAQVLMKLLNHPDLTRMTEIFQSIAQEKWASRVHVEINPASLA